MKFTRALVAVASIAAATPATAGKGHVHGVGSLELVADKEQLVISLTMPLDAAVGFERAPRTDAERNALAQTAKHLGDGAALFVPAAAAACTLAEQKVNVPHLDGKDAKAKGEHADIEASYTFRCTQPTALNGVETTIFRHFKRLYRLDAQRVTPGGQGSGRLTPKTPALRW